MEPEFDGRFPEVQPLAVTAEAVAEPPLQAASALQRDVVPAAAPRPCRRRCRRAGNMVGQIGRPQAEHLRHAGQMVDGMPQPLLDAAREPFVAQAVIYASAEPGRRDDQDPATATAPSADRTAIVPGDMQLVAAAQLCRPRPGCRWSLAIPAIKRSSPQQYAQFRQVVDALVGADGRVDLFEYCLRTVLFSYLDVPFGLRRPPAIRYRAMDAVAQPLAVVLSMLAYVGQKRAGGHPTGISGRGSKLARAGRARCPPSNVPAGLRSCAGRVGPASPKVKRAVIGGVAACIAADGQVTVEEGELLRAIAAVLACPMPPVAGNLNAGLLTVRKVTVSVGNPPVCRVTRSFDPCSWRLRLAAGTTRMLHD